MGEDGLCRGHAQSGTWVVTMCRDRDGDRSLPPAGLKEWDGTSRAVNKSVPAAVPLPSAASRVGEDAGGPKWTSASLGAVFPVSEGETCYCVACVIKDFIGN